MEIVTRTDPAPEESSDDAYRSPPHNLEAEQNLLGAILVNNEAWDRVAGFLAPEHFFEAVHARIFETAATLIRAGKLASPVTLKTYFERDSALNEIGGPVYLARLAAAAATIINAEEYGRLLYDLALRRRLIGLGTDVVNDAFDATPEAAARDIIESAEQALYELAETGKYGQGFQP
ncbi:MAG TPA: DnaB-like helicase N-terminal domain-containing protein, partial [Aestuariivirgaceae bacterium]|nr:DnaB-like helicase N-terminal domain-containing protein [Aestuariivirgaceae bacterium]